jgi:hypothetical protein
MISRSRPLQAAEARASASEAARVEMEMGRLDDWAARALLQRPPTLGGRRP